MRQIPITKALLILMTVVVLGGLVLNANHDLNAQNPHRAFLDILKPHVSKQVKVAYRVGELDELVTLREVGIDYVVVESDQRTAQAIPIHSINSIVLGEIPQIHFGQ